MKSRTSLAALIPGPAAAAAAVATLFAAGTASAAYTITDPSFELSGGTITGSATFGGNTEAATIDVGKLFSGMSADVWQTHSGQDNGRTAELESTTSYGFGRTTAPANATGNYWFHGQRSSTQGRGFMQYTQDSGQTTGLLTVSMDYWVYENRASDPLAGDGTFSFQIFAFNDPSQVSWVSSGTVTAGSTYNSIIGTGFITSGQTWNTVSSTAAATGFQTITATLDLDAGYDYIGIAVATLGDDGNSTGNSEQMAFDNFQVVPEPSSLVLIALGGLGLLTVRRRPA